MRIGPRRWLGRLAAVTTLTVAASLLVAAPAHAAMAFHHALGSFSVPVLGTATGVAKCTSGKVTGGGFEVALTSVRVLDSYPSSDTEWRVTVENKTPNVQQVNIRAVCAVGVPGFARVVSDRFINARTILDNAVICPDGSRSMGGGFHLPNSGFVANESFDLNIGWQAKYRNGSDVGGQVTTYALCTTAPNRTTASFPQTISPGRWGRWHAWCATGQVASGGGWDVAGSPDRQIVTASFPDSGWRWAVNNVSLTKHDLVYRIVCYPNG